MSKSSAVRCKRPKEPKEFTLTGKENIPTKENQTLPGSPGNANADGAEADIHCYYTNLNKYTQSFKSDDDSLATATHYARKLVKEFPAKAGCYYLLGACLTYQYEKFRKVEDLENALENNQKAVDLVDPKMDTARKLKICYHKWLHNLATTFRYRYHHHGHLVDLQEAEKRTKEACAVSQDAQGLQILGACQMDLYWNSGDRKHLEEALNSNDQALERSEHLQNDVERSQCLQNLVTSLVAMYREEMQPENHHAVTEGYLAVAEWYLNRAVSLNLKVVEVLEKLLPSPARVPLEMNLAIFYLEHYEAKKDMSDLQKAIDRMETAACQDSLFRQQCFQNLAVFYLTRYWVKNNDKDLQDAQDNYKKSFKYPSLNVLNTWDAAQNWASLEKEIKLLEKKPHQDSRELEAHLTAFGLLPIMLQTGDSMT
ncbi:hypothetical protein MVEN_00895300 [Mycena venus]|uniref:TPR-like protein n=1 Tax=Mycena venus TaxID=2733690 RepID=A0A8H6YEW4_9AGAR|nr:hypothetical protein MVEN_00895300 [Mycena venus]